MSIATAKGHLYQSRKNHRSTKRSTIIPPTAITPDVPLDPNDVSDNAALIMVIPMKTQDTNYTDLMGKFPVESFMRNNYVMFSFYRGYVHTEAMKDRSSASLVAAYAATFAYYRRSNQTPRYQRLDNETSAAVDTYLRDIAKVVIEFVPPNNKRTNTAERIIRTWRNHFISGLHSLDSRFPLQCRDYLLAQTDFDL